MDKSRRKVIVIAAVVIVALAVVGTGIAFAVHMLQGSGGGNASDKVYVEQISRILRWNSGVSSSYSGKVEAQQTLEIAKDSEKTVKEVLVAVGDTVEVGTPLFTYNTEDAINQIAQIRLDIEGITNDIASYNGQIADLEKERKEVPEDMRLEYTTQIQTLQTTIRQAEYDKKSKEAEIARYQHAIDNATVTSKIAGVVKTINESGTDNYGNSAPYMTVMATGEYRIKGTIDEQSVYNLSEDQPVIIRSRMDETQTWTGVITLIDMENPDSGNSGNDYYFGEGGGGESTSKYPFYVALDSTEGLILGQHVLIEPDYGQGAPKEGLWLDESYIVQDEEEPYVWAANGRNKLEKRKVELGGYDEEQMTYEILSGLAEEDYITWPMEGLYEGITTVTSQEEEEQ